MDARTIARTLLEVADIDYVGDPMAYALDAGEKTADWLVPKEHLWVHTLRSLGFKLKHNSYKEFNPATRENDKTIEFWSAEREVRMKSGEKLGLTVSQYEDPAGHLGVNISYKESWRKGEPGGIYGSRPIPGKSIKRVVADMIRRLERTKVEYEHNSYTRGVQETVNKVLKPYEYWTKRKDWKP